MQVFWIEKGGRKAFSAIEKYYLSQLGLSGQP
jgi:hypothetical protein